MAAQNFYLLTLVSVTPLSTDPNNKIQTIVYNVKQTSDSSNVTDLVKADFILSSSATIEDTDWTLDTDDSANGNYAIEFVVDKELDVSSYLVAYVDKSEINPINFS